MSAGARTRVVVIGGGLAGTTAALDAAEGGAQVTLLEVRPRLGGAACSHERDGLTLDNGQHVFMRCCTAYRAFLERVGGTGDTVLQDRLDVTVLAPGGRTGRLRRVGLPAPLHLAPALARYPHLTPLERGRAVMAALALRRVDPHEANDRRSFGEWLTDHGQSPAAVEALWDLIGLPTLNLHVDDASLAQAAFVFRTGLLEDAGAADIGYARAPLGHIHSGRAEAALRAAGVDVRLRTRAEAIDVADGGVRGVRSDGTALPADAVVLALPHDRAAGLLPPGALPDAGALAGLGTSPIVNLHVFYDRPVFDGDFAAAVGSPVQFLFDRTRSAGVERGQYLAVSLSGAEEEMALSPAELEARFLPALAALLPAAREARVERFLVTREHAATFRAAPGARRLRPGPRTGVEGLALAGAWTDTGWPATMEGAVRSGHAAAAVALERPARSEPDAKVAA